MILGTDAIRAALSIGAILCTPAPLCIEGAHIDVRFGAHYWRWAPDPEIRTLSLSTADPALCFSLLDASRVGEVIIPGRGFILAHTEEFIGTAPDSGLLPVLHTRSTMARWGLSVHLSAGFGDIGFSSRWTMEIHNHHDCAVSLPVGARVGCLTFERVEGAAAPYVGRYNATQEEWTPEKMLPRRSNW